MTKEQQDALLDAIFAFQHRAWENWGAGITEHSNAYVRKARALMAFFPVDFKLEVNLPPEVAPIAS